MKRCYADRNFREESLRLIDKMNTIVDEYLDQGFRLTVRQLYYQLVARDVIANTVLEYKRVASIINDAKLAGLMDWDAMEDRTREFLRCNRWSSGAEVLRAVAQQYHEDMWEGQSVRVFVVVEKEALSGVLDPVCRELDVPLLAARGYPSGSVLWEFTRDDLVPSADAGQDIVVLHLGDHDPSGVDMSRDLRERLLVFFTADASGTFELIRIALNMPQIEEQRPPENPAKQTDSRFAEYARKFGDKSWELDALKPEYLAKLIRRHVAKYINKKVWDAKHTEIEGIKKRLEKVAVQFEK